MGHPISSSMPKKSAKIRATICSVKVISLSPTFIVIRLFNPDSRCFPHPLDYWCTPSPPPTLYNISPICSNLGFERAFTFAFVHDAFDFAFEFSSAFSSALWARITKNPNVIHSLVHSLFARTTHLLTRLLACSLTLLTPSLMEKWMIRWLFTVCFFSTATKDDVITQFNDLIITFAMNQFEKYCLAFVVWRTRILSINLKVYI